MGGKNGVRWYIYFIYLSTDSRVTRKLRQYNEEKKIKQEEREVKVLLLLHCEDDKDDDEDSSDGLEDILQYVSDSKGYLLLTPDADCPYNRR